VTFIREILSDIGDKLSAKRFAALLLTSVLSAIIIGHVFYGLEISEHVFTGLVDTVIWSLAFIGSEKVVEGMGRLPFRLTKTDTKSKAHDD